MNLAKVARRRYTEGVTPLERLDNFTKVLNGPTIYIKRDDLLGGTAGGNKTRKLEFLMADAIKQGADTIVTGGAIQSNHCRLTLAASVKENMDCHFILEEDIPNTYKKEASGNNFLYGLLGVKSTKVVEKGTNLIAEMEALATELKKQGKKPYIIPIGGSNSIGALGYVACIEEIMAQLFDKNIQIDYIIAPSGSVGTHAGLLAGVLGVNGNIPIIGMSMSKTKDVLTEMTHELTQTVMKDLGIKTPLQKSDIIIYDDYVGGGYTVPTDGMIEAVQMLARTEGILLDPVYTGKVMAGMIDLIRNNHFKKTDNVLFLHTGGSPVLYTYKDILLEKDLYTR